VAAGADRRRRGGTVSASAALGLLAVVLVLLVAGIATYDGGRQQRRIATERATLRLGGSGRAPWRRALDRAVTRTPVGRSVAERLRRAGREHLHAGDVVGAAVAVAVGIALLLVQLIALPVAVVVAVAALVTADRYLTALVDRRAEAFAEQLPDIARIMSNAASAGMAIPNALGLTATEVEEPAKSLLAGAVRQMAVGQTLAGAMADLSERVPSREMSVLVSTVVIQQRAGGDVIEALREMSTNLEVRRDLRREVVTAMSGVKFTAYAVMGLGVAMLLIIETISSGTLRRMTESSVGIVILLVASGFYAVGGIAVRRLSKVDV
jgi:tight adherence protein B